jgi:hypothetical protein
MKQAFKMTEDNVGFNITFPNEWEVSVRWGKHHLCDAGKTTVEIAIYDPEDNWYILDGQRDELVKKPNTDIMGYVTPQQLTDILQEVAKQ